MAGHTGIPTHKTTRRLQHVLTNLEAFKSVANGTDLDIINAIEILGIGVATKAIAEKAGVPLHFVVNAIKRFELVDFNTPQPIINDEPKQEEPTTYGEYTFQKDFQGKVWVLWDEVAPNLNQSKDIIEDVLAVSVSIQSISLTKSNTRDVVTVSFYPYYKDEIDLAALFKQLKAGDIIGITPIKIGN
jgi:hypothetical protein